VRPHEESNQTVTVRSPNPHRELERFVVDLHVIVAYQNGVGPDGRSREEPIVEAVRRLAEQRD